jgi:hypothetical protein
MRVLQQNSRYALLVAMVLLLAPLLADSHGGLHLLPATVYLQDTGPDQKHATAQLCSSMGLNIRVPARVQESLNGSSGFRTC